ncbi:hypothetical protein OG956_14945 [Streptomyces sp. NBC_00557]|nr:hypothetical protein [Streptomyces sp. NBC_00557]WUC35429.1 hypothetical protein OG956_14945 [Streptomyces sp. NBC_00557]
MAAAIWRNHKTGALITRSLVAFDYCAHRTYKIPLGVILHLFLLAGDVRAL